ncbi:hypothetical protein Tco_0724521 [Tanacetum coccineum]
MHRSISLETQNRVYIQLQDYALWEIIEEGNSFKPVARTTTNEDDTSATSIPGAVTADTTYRSHLNKSLTP